MKFTRDSALWTVGMVGSIAVGLSAGIGDHGPLAWMSEGAKHTILLVSMVTGMVSGYLKSSPAPLSAEGKANEQIQKLGDPPQPQTPTVLPPAAALLLVLLLPTLASAQTGTEPMAWQPSNRPIADAISTAAVAGQAGAAAFVAVKDWRAGNHKTAWRTLCAGGIATGASEGIKAFVREPRPNGLDEKSFPSEHSAISAALSGWSFTFGVPLAVGVGMLRIDANWHHPKDVAAGWGIGAGAQALCGVLIR